MKAMIEPTGCSVRRGAVQIRIDLFEDDKDTPFHSHFVQLSPDITDNEIQKILKDVVDEFGAEWNKGNNLLQYWHNKPKKNVYAPLNVNAPVELLISSAVSKGEKSVLLYDESGNMQTFEISDSVNELLCRSYIKGLDIVARKDSFKGAIV